MQLLMPESVPDACTMLAEHSGAVPIAGGTDLMVHWPQRFDDHDRTYVDLSALVELRSLHLTDDELIIGALSTYWDFLTHPEGRLAFPILADAARQIGAVQIQTRGTWAGNVMNGSPAADGVAVLMACDAAVHLQSSGDIETVPLDEFYLGYKEMRRKPDQLLCEIHVPRRVHDVQFFEKVAGRRAQAITKVSTKR